VVEDDETLALGLQQALILAGYGVEIHERGETALTAIQDRRPDLLVLDIMLPGIDGLTVLERAKTLHSDLPVIMLTAKGAEEDKVRGLDAGADDYVTKPFSVSELMARIRARLRATQGGGETGGVFAFGHVEVDLRRRVLWSEGKEMRLTTHEAGVLSYLIAHQSRDVTREELLENVWGYSPTMQTRTVDNQILKLRKKVEVDPADPRHILTVHGVGYRFER
jgi:two-component system alkaline phosphatase synthesis response regulator PhoP